MRQIALLSIFLSACLVEIPRQDNGDKSDTHLKPTGAACDTGDSCEGGVCLTSTSDDIIHYEGGACSAECEGDTGFGCVEGAEVCLTYVATEESHCHQACAYDGPDDQCRDGYRCLSVAFLTFACMPPTPSMP